jgi:ribose-phosphate pyrophosphokinase
VATGFMEKQRTADGVSGETLFADVRGKTVIVVDDLIATGTTMARAAGACRDQGATRVYAAATHGVFVGAGANDVIGGPHFERTVVSDTVPPFRLDPAVVRDKLVVLDAARLFAAAIRAIHEDGSIAELVEG